MNYIIDRFEGAYAVVELENKKMVSVPCEALPDCVQEGDVIRVTIDQEETRARGERIQKRVKKLFHK